MIDLSPVFAWFQQAGDAIVATPFFQQYGLLVLLVWPLFTFNTFPIPIEIPIATLIYGHVSMILIFAFAWAGIYAGSILIYYLTMTGKIIKNKTTLFEEIEDSHMLSKYHWYFFSFGTSVFLISDVIMVWAATRHMPISQFFLPLLLGTFFRTVIAILVAIGIISLPNLFNYMPH